MHVGLAAGSMLLAGALLKGKAVYRVGRDLVRPGAASSVCLATNASPPRPMDTTLPAPPTPADGEPVYTPASDTLVWLDRFEQWKSDAAMMANYVTIDGHHGCFRLDRGAGINRSTAVRFDWTAKGDCQDDSRLLERMIPGTPREIYAQYSIRYSPGFAFDWTKAPGRCTGNAKKLFFLYSGGGESRFDFISENHWLGMGSDFDHPLLRQNIGLPMATDTWGDGNWHRVTMHVIQSSTPTSADGLIEAWIDGEKRWYYPNWASRSSGGWASFRIGANINQGAPHDQREWVDDVSVWAPR